MGKIHDALGKAEEQRATAGEGHGRRQAIQDAAGPAPAERIEQRRDSRRARIVVTGADPGVTEHYRTLRARIQSLRRERQIRSIVVTSALPSEGKTTTAWNLALSFGLGHDSNTCLLDGDLRTPSIHRSLPEPAEAGIGEWMEEDAKLEEALVRFGETRLWVLPVHALPPDPAETLASNRMRDLMVELHGRFETTIIDAPPVLGLPDATTLCDLCDAVLLVVRARGCSRDQLQAAVDRIDRPKLLGSVFNQSEKVEGAYEYGVGRRSR